MKTFWKVTGIVLVGLLLVGAGFAAGYYVNRLTRSQVVAARVIAVDRADKPSVDNIDPQRPDSKEPSISIRPDAIFRAGPIAQGGRGQVAFTVIKLLGGLALLTGYTALVAWLVARNSRTASGPPPEAPLDTLKRRYAAGEVDDKQFKAIKAQLEGK